jgi:hypothetical protein
MLAVIVHRLSCRILRVFVFCDTIRVKRMIFLELLIEQVFLSNFLALLQFMIRMKSFEGFLRVITALIEFLWRSTLSYSLWVKGAFSKLYVILQSLQALKVPTLSLSMLVESLAQLILVLVIQILSFDQDLRFDISLGMKCALSQFFTFLLKIQHLWVELLLRA